MRAGVVVGVIGRGSSAASARRLPLQDFFYMRCGRQPVVGECMQFRERIYACIASLVEGVQMNADARVIVHQ